MNDSLRRVCVLAMTRAHLYDFQLIASMVARNFDFFDFGGSNALFGILVRFIILNSSNINVDKNKRLTKVKIPRMKRQLLYIVPNNIINVE